MREVTANTIGKKPDTNPSDQKLSEEKQSDLLRPVGRRVRAGIAWPDRIKGKGQMPTWFLVGQKHCFLTPLISPISSGFSPLARFSRLAAAAFSMSPYGGSPDRSIQAAA